MEIKEISSNIKKFRELKNITREHIAAELDMSVSGYSKIERGEIDLTLSKLDKIANVLEVSVPDILSFDATKIFNISNNSNNSGVIGNIEKDNNSNTVDEYTKKYIAILEQENERLKNQKEG